MCSEKANSATGGEYGQVEVERACCRMKGASRALAAWRRRWRTVAGSTRAIRIGFSSYFRSVNNEALIKVMAEPSILFFFFGRIPLLSIFFFFSVPFCFLCWANSLHI